MLDPKAAAAAVAEAAQARVHRSDGFSSDWHAGMPKQEPEPVRQPTVREVELMRAADWTAFVVSRIDAAFEARAWRDAAMTEAVGKALGEIRKQLRSEFEEQLGQLRADVTIQRAHERHEQDHGGEIIDMLEPRKRRG